MRSVLARFCLLTLLLLLVQGGGGAYASTGQLVGASASYLPQDAPGAERQRVDENATIEVDDDDDASRDGDVGVEVCEILQALSKPVVGTSLLRSWRYRRTEGGLDLLLFLRVALPLRGPPSPGLWRGPVRT